MTTFDAQADRQVPVAADLNRRQAVADDVDLAAGLRGLSAMVSAGRSLQLVLGNVADFAAQAIPGADGTGVGVGRPLRLRGQRALWFWVGRHTIAAPSSGTTPKHSARRWVASTGDRGSRGPAKAVPNPQCTPNGCAAGRPRGGISSAGSKESGFKICIRSDIRAQENQIRCWAVSKAICAANPY
jgi:hypothetical protein